MQTTQATKTRLDLLDSIRGATLLSMVTYHAVWDLVYLFGVQWDWYKGGLGFLWQQSICWTFIFLSGFCWPLGRRPLKRGLTVLAGGAAVTLVTVLAMPESRVVFGVLTLLGSCALLLIPLEKLLRDAHLLSEAGCFGIVLEKIPAALAARVTAEIPTPTIGIGAGAGCDGQVLVIHDMLGINKGFSPRFLRRYADLHTVMTGAVEQYVRDVKECDFPNEKEQY